jgi:hypothetical protein
MTFYEDSKPAANVVIAKTAEAIAAFLRGDDPHRGGLSVTDPEDESTFVLSTSNGTLISLEDSSAQYGSKLILKFVDSAGQTIQKLFGLSLTEAIKRSRFGDTTGYFLISYGMGIGEENWSPPMWYQMHQAKYATNADGLDLTILELIPKPMGAVGGLPAPALADIIYKSAFTSNLQVPIGEFDDKGNYMPNSQEYHQTVSLITKFAEQLYGLPCVFVESPPPSVGGAGKPLKIILHEYFSRNYSEMFVQSTAPTKPPQPKAVPTMLKNISTLWGTPKVFGTGGDVVIKPFNPEKMKVFNNLGIDLLLVGPGPYSGGFAKDLKVCMDISTEYRTLQSVTNPSEYLWRFLKNFFDALKPVSISPVIGSKGAVYEAEKPLMINNIEELRILKDEGMIANTDLPVVVFGSKYMVAAVKQLLKRPLAKKTDPNVVRQPTPGRSRVASKTFRIASNHNLLKFRALNPLPIVSVFRNTHYFQGSNEEGGTLTEDQYKKYIAGYLKEQLEMYNTGKTDLLSFYNYDDAAKELYESLTNPDASSLGDMYLATGSNTSDLAEFLHFYYNYAMLGNIEAEVEVLPSFNLTRSNILDNVDVTILKNPSSYSHIIDNVTNSYYSGTYRLIGYKHTITNNSAKTSLRLVKLTLGTSTAGKPTK